MTHGTHVKQPDPDLLTADGIRGAREAGLQVIAIKENTYRDLAVLKIEHLDSFDSIISRLLERTEIKEYRTAY